MEKVRTIRNSVMSFLMLAFICAVGVLGFSMPAQAASKITAYSISTGNTSVYRTSSLTGSRYGYIYGSDEITLLSIGTSSCRVQYKITGGTKTGYIATSAVLLATSGTNVTSPKQVTTYRRPGGTSYGYISSGDTVLVLGQRNGYTQVYYPAGSSYKIAWVKGNFPSDYQSYTTISAGTYKIETALNSNYVLDVDGAKTADGSNLQIWTKAEAQNQKFTVTNLGSGWYKITDVNSGKVLDVSGGVSASQVNVQIWTWNGSNAQKWRFYNAGNGYYYIQNALGYYLDVAGGNVGCGINVWVYSGNNSSAQKWKLASVSSQSPSFTSSTSYTTVKYVNTSSANLVLRASASSYARQLASMPRGSAVTVYSTSGSWAYVSYNGTKGYCLASYLSSTKPAENTSTQSMVRARLDQIANGTLKYNNSTVLQVGKTFTGTRASEQCKGYAKDVFYLCFGITPGSTQSNNYLLNSTSGMTRVGYSYNLTASGASSLLSKARPGDFVQVRRRSSGGPHSMIVYSVSSTGMTVMEANTDGKNSIKRQYYTWAQLANKNIGMSLYTASSYKLK